MLKRIISIFTVAALLFDAGGYLYIYFQLRKDFKEESAKKITDYIPEDCLELITFEQKDLQDPNIANQIEEGEIEYRGNMYDIYKITRDSERVYLYCINDHNEILLERAFSDYVVNKFLNSQSGRSNLNIVFQALDLIAVNSDFKINEKIPFFELLSLNNDNNISQFITEVPTPPPIIA